MIVKVYDALAGQRKHTRCDLRLALREVGDEATNVEGGSLAITIVCDSKLYS